MSARPLSLAREADPPRAAAGADALRALLSDQRDTIRLRLPEQGSGDVMLAAERGGRLGRLAEFMASCPAVAEVQVLPLLSLVAVTLTATARQSLIADAGGAFTARPSATLPPAWTSDALTAYRAQILSDLGDQPEGSVAPVSVRGGRDPHRWLPDAAKAAGLRHTLLREPPDKPLRVSLSQLWDMDPHGPWLTLSLAQSTVPTVPDRKALGACLLALALQPDAPPHRQLLRLERLADTLLRGQRAACGTAAPDPLVSRARVVLGVAAAHFAVQSPLDLD